MKQDRLIGIITTLQQKGRVTAPYLAEKFEVSRRTINRDIEAICRAGIPIVSVQGTNGGFELMEGFSLDTTVFTKEELQSVFIGLQSLDSISHHNRSGLLAEKMGGILPDAEYMTIDLASFHKDSLAEKIELLKQAIHLHRQVTFRYYYPKGESDKLIEPLRIVFKWAGWYIFGYCPDRVDFRLYKLSRLWELEITETTFTPRQIPADKLLFGQHMTDDKIITALYQPEIKYKLVEEYGPTSFSETEDGLLFAEWGFSSYISALDWFLGLGSKVKVLAPADFKELYLSELKKTLKQYRN